MSGNRNFLITKNSFVSKIMFCIGLHKILPSSFINGFFKMCKRQQVFNILCLFCTDMHRIVLKYYKLIVSHLMSLSVLHRMAIRHTAAGPDIACHCSECCIWSMVATLQSNIIFMSWGWTSGWSMSVIICLPSPILPITKR